MTFWTTLWYAGTVVLTVAADGQTLEHCEQVGVAILEDMASGPIHEDYDLEQFSYTCETELLSIGTRK